MTDEKDEEIHADPPFADDEGEKAPPRPIVYPDGADAHERAEGGTFAAEDFDVESLRIENHEATIALAGTREDDTVQPVNSFGTANDADEPEAETFESDVPDHEAAKLRIENKEEPLLDKKGKGKGKGKTETPDEPSMALVLTGAPEPEELVLVRPWTKAESEDADKKMVKAGGELFKRMEIFRKCVLEFDAHKGWAQLGFRNVRDWAQARFGIEGKGIYAELTAARTEKVLTAVIEKENEEGREVPVPPKIPRDMLLALKDVPADKMPEVIEAAYTIGEKEMKDLGKDGKVVTTAKNVKDAISSLGLNRPRTKPEKPAKPAGDASGVGGFFGTFDPAANPALPGTTEETKAAAEVAETPIPPAIPVEVSAPSECKPIPLPIVGQIAYDLTTKVVSFFATVQGTTYELRALKSEFPPSMFEVADLFPAASAGKRDKRDKTGVGDTPTGAPAD